MDAARQARGTQPRHSPAYASSVLPRHRRLPHLSWIPQRQDRDQGAGGADKVSLTPKPATKASVGILHAGRGVIGNASITLVGAGTGAILTMGADVLAA